MRMGGTRPEKHDGGRATWRARAQDSKGMLLVLASEFFATCMGAAARLLETGDGGGMGTLQVCLWPCLPDVPSSLVEKGFFRQA